MIYNVAKAIGASATVLCGKIDAILLTGGIAYSDYVISRLKKRISFLAPIYVYPGENEMESLAFNAIGATKERVTSSNKASSQLRQTIVINFSSPFALASATSSSSL